MQFISYLLNYSKDEATLEDLPTAGVSTNYVYRETKRALEGVNGNCQILPGIDINLPTDDESRKASPKDSYEVTFEALRARADGLIFSCKYSEMMHANLKAAGKAVREGIKAGGEG